MSPTWRTPTCRLHSSVLVVLLASVAVVLAASPGTDIATFVSQGIDANFSGDYDQASVVFSKIREVDPGHPAHDFYQATVLFWRSSVDPSNPVHDEEIERLLNGSIAKSQAWLDAGKNRLEALQYLGLAYTYLGRLEAQRGRLYAGGSKGEKGRVYLEEVVETCDAMDTADRPGVCGDVLFPLGAYTYFAGRLPGLLRRVNFLWFVPRGTTGEGLDMLERGLRDSELHRWGTQVLLMQIYSIFEDKQRPRALALSRELRERYPDNPMLELEHAVLLNRMGRYGEAAASARAILGKCSGGVRNYDATVALSAQLILAEADLGQGHLDAAEKKLEVLAGDPDNQQNTLTPRILLLRGMLADARGRRKQALAFYKKVTNHKGRTMNRQAGKEARRYMESPYKVPVERDGPQEKQSSEAELMDETLREKAVAWGRLVPGEAESDATRDIAAGRCKIYFLAVSEAAEPLGLVEGQAAAGDESVLLGLGCIDPVHGADCPEDYRKALWNAAEYGVRYNRTVARHRGLKTREVALGSQLFRNRTAALLDEELHWNRICVELGDTNPVAGGQDLVVCGKGPGLARVVRPGASGMEEKIYTWTCSDADFHRLLNAMIDCDFFTVQPSDRTGVPEEPRPRITVTDGGESLFALEDWLEPVPPPCCRFGTPAPTVFRHLQRDPSPCTSSAGSRGMC